MIWVWNPDRMPRFRRQVCSKFPIDGMVKMKDHLPKDFRLHLGNCKSFLFEDWIVHGCLIYLQNEAERKDRNVLPEWLYAKVAVLYSQQNFTGHQFSSFNSGAMRSCLHFFRTSHAAQFGTSCGRLSGH